MAGNIDRDIKIIANAESGEDVRSAIISAIQDLNQNGGNAQTLNGYGSDEFTKNPQFEQFIDEEVGQVHLVLDAINKGITLRVIELGNIWIGPEANNDVQIQVPDTVRDRQLLTVDDFYADIVEVEGGTGENASWQKSDSYDSALGIYHYAHGALAGRVKLHFYAKRASATAVQDYNVHARDRITANGEYNADPGEAWDKVTVDVNVKEEITCNVTENHREYVPANPETTSYNKVVVDVPDNLEEGGVTINQATFDQTFTPTSPNVGFSNFRVQANVRFNTQPKEVRISDAEFEDVIVTPDSTHAGLSQVSIVNDMQLEEVTVSQNGIVEPSSGFAALKKVTVQVPTPTPRLQEKTVTQNGDVTADSGFDGLSTVHVQVPSGGGGDCNIMTKAAWDALSFAEKKASGLTVIKNNEYDTTGDWFDYSGLVFPLTIECELYDTGHKTVDIPAMTRAIVFQGIYNNGVGNYDNIEFASPLSWTYDHRSDYNKVTPIGSENPHDEGWYELSSGGNRSYNATSDITVNPNKTYYTKEDPNMIEVHYRSTDATKMIFDSMVTILDNTSATSIYYENGYNGDTSYSVYGTIISIDDANADIVILGEYYDGNVHEITTDTDYDAIICITTKASQRVNLNGQIDVVGTYTSKFDGSEKLYNDNTKSCVSIYYGVESGAVITAYAVQDTPGYTRQVGSAIIGVKANNS